MSLFKRNHLIKGSEKLTEEIIKDIEELKKTNDKGEQQELLRRIIRNLEFSEESIKRVYNTISDKSLLSAVIKAFEESEDLIKEYYSRKQDTLKQLLRELEDAFKKEDKERIEVIIENIKNKTKELLDLEKTLQVLIKNGLDNLDDEDKKVKKVA